MFQIIAEDILSFFFRYAGQGSKIAAVVFLCVFFIGCGYIRRKKGGSFFNRQVFFRAVVAAALAMYVYIVIGITMLSRSEGYSAQMNLRLFSTFYNDFISRKFVYENIMLFVPLGILLFLLAKPFQKMFVSVLTGTLCSLVIETLQYVLQLGRFEIDDIMTNTTGMLLGFLVCKLSFIFSAKLRAVHQAT